MLSFNSIPQNLRVPLFYAEFDNSQANTGEQSIQRTLIIGQMLPSGTALPDVPVISLGVGDTQVKAGYGSMLALMVDRYRKNDSFGEVWTLPLADAGAATASVGSIDFTHVPTVSGNFSFGIMDQLVTVAISATQTLDQIATALAATINLDLNLPVTAAVDGTATTKVNLTAKNKGVALNDVPLSVNPGGVFSGQNTPAGLTYTIVQPAGGATNPILTAGLANLGDMPFDFIVLPYYDTASLDAIKGLLNDQTGRWSWVNQVYGHGFAAMRGTLAEAQTLGGMRNDQHMTILPENGSPTPHWLWAPAYCGAAAVALKADPARPVQTLAVNGVVAPPVSSRFDITSRNTLLFTGMSTFAVSDDGTVRLENLITTYQKNAFGQPDNSYLEIETMFQLMFLMRDLKGDLTSKYPRAKLASSVARLAPGVQVVTTAMIRSEIIAHYRTLEYNGQAQDSAAFAAGLIVTQNVNNHNRVDILWAGTIMNQLRLFAVLAQFRQ